MRKTFISIVFALTGAIAGCGGTTTTTTPTADMAKAKPADMATFMSDCGQPGDKGNDIGVGKFCMGPDDCTGNGKATLCTHLFDMSVYFCTTQCMKNGPVDQCGMNASCECQAAGCGCTPNQCLPPTDGGTKG